VSDVNGVTTVGGMTADCLVLGTTAADMSGALQPCILFRLSMWCLQNLAARFGLVGSRSVFLGGKFLLIAAAPAAVNVQDGS
jgi:hypothetical protein